MITSCYSTSFSVAVSFLSKDIRDAIYSIYGFVRLADEIVDTFHEYDKEMLLKNFERDYYEALNNKLSLNPALNSFQLTVRKYNIEDELIQAFLKSMNTDLYKKEHATPDEINEYIYGSAEVVGLMCLRVFVGGDDKLYEELKQPARKLGAAFQKVNFLRDLKNDMEYLDRKYFHNTVNTDFDENSKLEIIKDISADFNFSLQGMKKLPDNSKLGVLIAYYYYRRLLYKIRRIPAKKLLEKRIRVSTPMKIFLLLKAVAVLKLKLF